MRCLQLKRIMAEGQPAGFAVDGPRGPARTVQPGRSLAREADGQSRRAVPHGSVELLEPRQLGPDANPKPFSTVALCVGQPIHVGERRVESKRGIEAKRLRAWESALHTPRTQRAAALLSLILIHSDRLSRPSERRQVIPNVSSAAR